MEQTTTFEWLYSPAFYWLLWCIIGYFAVWIIAVIAGTSKSTRLEITVLNGYLLGVILHLVAAITGYILLFMQFFSDTVDFWALILFLLGNLLVIILDIIFIIVLIIMIKRIPKF